MGYVKQVSEIVQRFQADVRSATDVKLLTGFAALASSENRVFLRQILPPVESLQPASSSRRELKLQLKLTSVAIECLKISIILLMDQSFSPTPIDETVVIWQRFNFYLRTLKLSILEFLIQIESSSWRLNMYCYMTV